MTTARTLEFSNLLPIINVVSANGTNNTAGTIQVTTNEQGTSVLKGLIEPLPASALKGLIKIEPTQNNTYTPGFIKVEPTSDLSTGHSIIEQDQVSFYDMKYSGLRPYFSTNFTLKTRLKIPLLI